MEIMVINGPNLNLLGKREPNIYGNMSLAQIQDQMLLATKDTTTKLSFFQSNLEGELVDKIQECLGTVDGIIINAAAYTHTSVAIRDAIAAIGLPAVEVHLSNRSRREDFRQKSFISAVCVASVEGFGPLSYQLALMGLVQMIEQVRQLEKKKEEK